MEQQAILRADYLDIVFDNRNKLYGSYELRKNYHVRIKKAGLSIIVLCALLAGYANYKKEQPAVSSVHAALQPHTLADIPVHTTPIHIDPPKPKPANTAPAVKPTIANPVMKVVPDDLVTTPPPTIDDMKSKEPGLVTTDGSTDGTTVATTRKTGGGGETLVAGKPEPPAEPLKAATEMPSFIGNMSEYLQRHLDYPLAAREAGVAGSVIIQFVVDEEGSISNARIIRGIGGGCDEEALRVVKRMPKWKPGKQNGRAVKVYYTLPIRFVLQ